MSTVDPVEDDPNYVPDTEPVPAETDDPGQSEETGTDEEPDTTPAETDH